VSVRTAVLVAFAVSVGMLVAPGVAVLLGVDVATGVAVTDGGAYSSAPMSATAIPSPLPSMGLDSPSKSMDGAPSVVPASIKGDVASR